MSKRKWNNWKLQMENSVEDLSELTSETVDYNYNMRITPYSLMKDDENCPIWRQSVPSIGERKECTLDYREDGMCS